MRKILLLLFFIFMFLLVGCSTLSGSKETNNNLSQSETKEFAFIFKYGVGAKNVLNTFDHKFIRDMISEEPITVNITMNKNQLNAIRNKMREINFYNYPNNFKQPMNMKSTPYMSYYFKVQDGKQVKELYWDDDNISDSIEAKKLRELNSLIIKAIEETPEYKALPEPKSGYQ